MDLNDKVTSSGHLPPYSERPVQPTPQMGGVVVTQPVAVPCPTCNQMGSKPTLVICKSCHAEIVTRVVMTNTLRAHLCAFLLCVFGCWPCVCIPYCTKSCKSADHFCPNCGSYIGTYLNQVRI